MELKFKEIFIFLLSLPLLILAVLPVLFFSLNGVYIFCLLKQISRIEGKAFNRL